MSLGTQRYKNVTFLHVCDNIYSLYFLDENFWLNNDSCDIKQYRS